MFINKEKQEQEEIKPSQSYTSLDQGESKKPFFYNKEILAVILVAVLAVGGFFYFMYFKKSKLWPAKPPTDQTADDQGSGGGNLPGGLGNNGGVNGNGLTGDELKAENLTFAQFYQKIEDDDFDPQPKSLDLPINVKIDVANYYDISRKINMDPYIDKLNNDGFAVLDNPMTTEADNFYSAYNSLSEKEIPILITSDFLIYYYQNTLKDVFKEIEKDVFFEDLWQINKNFYKMADGKYRERHKRVGLVNDPILEGLRLETAYFAVALNLLKPKPDQITQEVSSDVKFTQKEAADFEFNLPVYLQEDVVKEIGLIAGALHSAKSPTLLYNRNYKEFIVPEEYKSNAKLHNYFLASKWLNSVFPLYYKSDSCPDCLLDKDDWLINMIAACSIAKDFSQTQELKNKWAKIYKIISFFSGLRRDLTYLHYQDSLIDLFGADYKIDEIFSQENASREDNLLKLQDRIAKYEFSEIEGSIERDDSTKPILGLRVLQESYWPNDYIFRQLIYPNVALYLGETKKRKSKSNLITQCLREALNNRCQGIGLDVINLIYPIPESNNYFQENTNYQNYDNQAILLRNQLDNFNFDSWHNNNFWITLSIADLFLNSTHSSRPDFIGNNNWQEKNINTVLGSWVNLQLPADKLAGTRKEGSSSSLTIATAGNDYDYIEQDLVIVNELIANTKMLSQMLQALKVVKDYEYSKLNRLARELDDVKKLIKKELNNEILNFDDIQIISNLTKQFVVAEKSEKSIKLEFKNSSQITTESINGVKLLIIVYNRDDKKVFAVGPVFNYQEK